MGIFASMARARENDSEARLSEARARESVARAKENDSRTKQIQAEIQLEKAKRERENDSKEQDRKTMNLQASIQERVMAAEERARESNAKLKREQMQMEERLRQEQAQMQERLRQEQAQMQERLKQELLRVINDLQRQITELRQEILASKQDNAIKNRILVGLQAAIKDLLANNQSFESKLACLVTDVQLIREDFQGHFDSIGDQLSLLNNEMQQMQSEENRVPALENIPMLEMQQI